MTTKDMLESYMNNALALMASWEAETGEMFEATHDDLAEKLWAANDEGNLSDVRYFFHAIAQAHEEVCGA